MADQPLFRNSDRRRETRISARFEVKFREGREMAKALRAYSLNFSAGGMCLKTQKVYEIGQPLVLNLEVQGEKFELAGVVAWVRSGAIGVRFEDVATADKRRLEAVIA